MILRGYDFGWPFSAMINSIGPVLRNLFKVWGRPKCYDPMSELASKPEKLAAKQMSSGVHPITDFAKILLHFRFVPNTGHEF